MITKIEYLKRLKLKNPVMIVGLPGIGSVGSIVSEQLRLSLNAKPFARLYSPYFPPMVKVVENGSISLLSNTFYYTKIKKQDVVILSGDAQVMQDSFGAYEVSEKIVKFFSSLNGKLLYAIGGYNIADHYITNPRVFAAANKESLLSKMKEYNVNIVNTPTNIFGALGLIPAIAKDYRIDAICLMGESGFVDIDANAAKAVLNVLFQIFNFSIDLSDLDKIKAELEKLLEEMKPPSDNTTYIR